MSGFGHTGRDRAYRTMGPIAQALSGMTYLSGLPGLQPAGWGWSYMDDTGGMYEAMCALSALYHRNMTGQGQHVDKSQWITGVALNGPAFLDIQANGRSTMREGYPPGNRTHWPGTPLVGADGGTPQRLSDQSGGVQRLVYHPTRSGKGWWDLWAPPVGP